jgi:rRNA processing protein Krr1/Pno1
LNEIRDSHRETLSSIDEVSGALFKVKLANKLGCESNELSTQQMVCPKHRLGMIIGKNGANIVQIEQNCKVSMDVNKLTEKVTLTGSESSVQKAVAEIEKIIRTEDIEVDLAKPILDYLCGKYVKVMEEIRKEYSDVYIDVKRNTGKLTIRGEPEKIDVVKGKITGIVIVSQQRELVGKEPAIILGTKGATIDRLCSEHAVSIEIEKKSDDSAAAIVSGPPSTVEEVLNEIDEMLNDSKEVTDIIHVDVIIKNILLADSGRHIKALQSKVNESLSEGGGGNCYLSMSKSLVTKDHPELIVKTKQAILSAAIDRTRACLKELDSLVVKLKVDMYVVPVIIGKGGETIKKLTAGKSAFVEVDRNTGDIWYAATTADVRDEVGKDVNDLVENNTVLRVESDPGTLQTQFREMNRSGIKKQLTDNGVWIDIDDVKACYILRGKEDAIEEGKNTILEYISKNQMAAIPMTDEDRDSLLSGGKACKLNVLSEEFDVKINIDRTNYVATVRGSQDKVDLAAKKLNQYLNGGDGHSVARLPVTEQVVGVVIGKGGKTRQELEKKYEGVSINISKSFMITIRGPDQSVTDCRVEIAKMIASARVSEIVTLSAEQMEILEKKDFVKKIAQQTSVGLTVDGTKVTAKGSFYDVRDSVSLLNELITGEYKTTIELDAPQYAKVRNTARDLSHFQRMEAVSSATIQLDLSSGSIVISGKRINVKKGKDQIYGFLDFVLPGEISRTKITKPLYGTVGQASRLADITARAGGLAAYLDRDLGEVILRSPDPEKVKVGTELVQQMIKDAEKLAFVLEVSAADSWIMAAVIGKKGAQVSALTAKYPGCKIDFNKDARTITVTGDSEETVQSAKEAVLAVVEKVKAENVFLCIPEKYVSHFVGKGGAHVKELSAKYGADIQRIQKGEFNFKITGEAPKVGAAKKGIEEWLDEKEKAATPLSYKLEQDSDVGIIIRQKGLVANAVQEEFHCKVDIDKKSLIVTIRGPNEEIRQAAMNRLKEVVAKEKSDIAAAREAAAAAVVTNGDSGHDAAESSTTTDEVAVSTNGVASPHTEVRSVLSAADPNKSVPEPEDAGSDGKKESGSEYPSQPVGLPPATNGDKKKKKKKKKPKVDESIEKGTETGKSLFAMLMSGN